jgi:hypothetical protein
MFQYFSRIVIALLAFAFILGAGCRGQAGRAIDGVRDLEPEVKKRNDQINELSKPK